MGIENVTYDTGTATVAAGGTAVTGQGTAWKTAGLLPGDQFWAAGLSVTIAAVNSDTSLTLAKAWPGSARNAAAYEVRYVNDGTRATAALETLRSIVTLLKNGNLGAIAGLATQADRLPYYTGAGQAGLATLTAFARTLLDDANGAAAYGTLGIIPNGQLPSRLKTVGSDIYDDYNAVPVESGFYRMNTSALNAPPVGFAVCIVVAFSATACAQLALGLQGGAAEPSFHFRTYNSNAGGYGAWRSIVAERGSNANGDYVRFADGTQICFLPESSTRVVDVQAASGSLYRTNNVVWTFPAAFSSTPATSGSLGEYRGLGANAASVFPTAATMLFHATTQLLGIEYSMIAIGRWF